MTPNKIITVLLSLLLLASAIVLGVSIYQGNTDPFPGTLGITSLLCATLLAYLSPKLSEDFEKRRLHTNDLRKTVDEWLEKAEVPDGGEPAEEYLNHDLKVRDETAELESSPAMKDFMNNHTPGEVRQKLHGYLQKKTELVNLYYSLFNLIKARSIELTGLKYGVEKPPRLTQMPRRLYRHALYSIGKEKPYIPDLRIVESGDQLWQLKDRGENVAEAYDKRAIENCQQACHKVLNSTRVRETTRAIGEGRADLEERLSQVKVEIKKVILKPVFDGSCEYV